MELNLICIEECRNLIFYLIYCNEYYKDNFLNYEFIF